MRHLLPILSLIAALSGCATLPMKKVDGHGIIGISMTSKGFAQKGFGVVLTLVDTANHDTVVTKSLSALSPHAVATNVPTGVYRVAKIQVPIGNYLYSNWSSELQNFFPLIPVSPNGKYYIGSFVAHREIGLKNVVRVKLVSSEIPMELKQKIEGPGTGWREGSFTSISPNGASELIVY